MRRPFWAGGIKSSCGQNVLWRQKDQSLCGIERLLWARKGEDPCGYKEHWCQKKVCKSLRGLCGPEVLKAHAGETTLFVVKTLKACLGLEEFCGPEERKFLLCTGVYETKSTGGKIENLKKTYTIYNFLIQANSTKVLGAFNKKSKMKK